MKSSRFYVLAACFLLAVFTVACRFDKPSVRYQCPMHLQFQADKQTPCSICKMDLVPMEEKKHEGRAIPVTEKQARLMGITLGTVQERELRRSLRISGHVANDPYLANLLIEYQNLVGYKNAPTPDYGSQPGAPYQQQDLQARASSSQTRLQQIGIDARSVVAPGAMQIRISQPTTFAWINARVFEEDIALIRGGQMAEVTSAAFPGRVFKGQVIAVDSAVGKDNHTIKARVAVENPNGVLRTDMAVQVTVHIGLGKRLAVPFSAVLDTGTRQVVFVGPSEGPYEHRTVRLGQQADGWVEVLSGLDAGETVVTAGNFLLDSESQLQALSE